MKTNLKNYVTHVAHVAEKIMVVLFVSAIRRAPAMNCIRKIQRKHVESIRMDGIVATSKTIIVHTSHHHQMDFVI